MRFYWWLVLPLLLLATPVTADAQAGPKKAAPRLDQFGDPLPEGAFYRLGTERMRHFSAETLIFSADGKQLLSGGGHTAELRVWDIATGDLVKSFPQGRAYNHLIASPDDQYLAAVSYGGVTLLDKASFKILASWTCSAGWHCLAFENDSKTLVGLGRNETVYRWDVKTLKEKSQQILANTPKEFHTGRKAEWIISADGTVAAGKAGNYDAENRHRNLPWQFWDTVTGKEIKRPVKAGSVGWRTWLSSDGNLIAGNLGPGATEVWDTISGKSFGLDPVNNAKQGSAPVLISFLLAFHPDDKHIAVGDKGKLALHELATGKRLWSNEPSNGVNVQCIAFSRDGKLVATTDDMAITVMDSASGKPIGFSAKDPGTIALHVQNPPAIFCPDSQTYVAVHGEYLSLRNTATGQEVRKLVRGYWNSMSADGRFMVVQRWIDDGVGQFGSSARMGLGVVELATGKVSSTPMQGTVMLAPDGKTWAWLRSGDGKLLLIDAATERILQTFDWKPKGPKAIPVSIAVAPNLKLAAVNAASSNRGCEIWDLETNKPLRSLEGTASSGVAVFLPNTRRLVGLSADIDGEGVISNKTTVWDASTGKKLFQIPIACTAISPNGKWLLLGSGKTFVLGSAETGRLHIQLPNLPSFSAAGDGALLTNTDDDRQVVTVRETISGLVLYRWRDPAIQLTGATLSPDGRTLVIGSRNGTLLVYDATGLATEPGKLPKLQLTKADADRFWADLASTDGPRVHRALWSLIAAENQSAKEFKERAKVLDTKEAEGLAADLDNPRYAVREKAMERLPKLAAAEEVLKKTLAGKPSLEVKQRIELLLPKLPEIPQDPELLRLLRMLFILEQIGTAEARQYLETLAAGVAEAHVTREAAATLERVRKRK